MSNTNDGGQAFPQPFYDDKGHCIDGFDGMTLRDYFAAKAMQGLLADSRLRAKWHEFASDAYEMADAMLEARVK